MKKRQIIFYLVFILMLFTSLNTFSFITDVFADDQPPDPDPPAYDYWYAPANSFGIDETKEVNWTTFKALFQEHFYKHARYKRYSHSSWTDGTQYLSLNKTWNESGFWKVDIILDVPVDLYSVNVSFGCDLQVLNYVEREGYEIWLNYSANATETYQIKFNWSDIASIPNLEISKHRTDGKFWISFKRDNVPAGYYVFDPTFGMALGGTSAGNTVTFVTGTRISGYSPLSDGCATSITCRVDAGHATHEMRYGLYDVSDHSLLGQTAKTFPPSLNAETVTIEFDEPIEIFSAKSYGFAVGVWGDASTFKVYSDAANVDRYNGDVDGDNMPNPGPHDSSFDWEPGMYCTYYIVYGANFSNPTPIMDELNISIGNVLCNVTITEDEGNTSTCDWYTSTDNISWTWQQQNTSILNESISYNYNCPDYQTTYYWKVTANDTDGNNESVIYNFETTPYRTTFFNDTFSSENWIESDNNMTFEAGWENFTYVSEILYGWADVNEGDYCSYDTGTLMGITKVEIPGLSWSKSSSGGGNTYEDYTYTGFNATVDTTYSIEVTTSGSWKQGISVWVDWDNDKTLEVWEYIDGGYITGVGTSTFDLVVPSNATTGSPILMRVVTQYTTKQTNPCDSAESFGDGEGYSVAVGRTGVEDAWIQGKEIYKPSGYTWDKFYADVNDTEHCSFALSDNSTHYNISSGLTGNGDDISSLTNNSLYIFGNFSDASVSMGSWNITWTSGAENTAPTVVNSYPVNNSVDITLKPQCVVWVNDTDNDALNCTWQENSTGSFVTRATNNSQCANTKINYTFVNFNTESTKYWYKVFADDGTDNVSSIFCFTTDANNTAPTITGEAPVNQSTGISTTPTIYAIVTDADSDTMTCNFYTSPDGSAWTWRQTNSTVSTGTNISYIYSGATSYSTKYYWKVTADDGTDNTTSSTYDFTTEAAVNTAPFVNNSYPINESIDQSLLPQCVVWVNDTDGDNLNCTWQENSTGSWITRATNNSQPANTKINYTFTEFNTESTKYWYRVWADDGTDNESNTFCFTTQSNDTTPPTITINFAGNLSDSGGPYWRPPGESTQLTGVWSDGYYTNDSRQQEDWIYINLTVGDSGGVPNVWLQWKNGSTWTNWTYAFVNKTGGYFEFNTSGNIQTCEGFDYSFNIVANDTIGNSNWVGWNKTVLGGVSARRSIQLNYTLTNISYTPYYLYEFPVKYGASDDITKDRLHHDQGVNSGVAYGSYDAARLLDDIPTDNVQDATCGLFIGSWFDESVCITPFTLDNIYYHFWWSSQSDDIGGEFEDEGVGWYKSRSYLNSTIYNEFDVYASEQKSGIYYDGLTSYDNYSLDARIISTTPTSFTDNDIYEFRILMRELGGNPCLISNRSFTSFVLFNVPDNATLNTSHADTDSDGLSDWTELYITYTNPFLTDTDNDGVSDYDESLSGSDPNNYTDTIWNHAPFVNNSYPVNNSVDQSLKPMCVVWVNDTDNDDLTCTWQSNVTDGSTWVQYAQNLSQSANTKINYTFTEFNTESTKYWYRVWADDATDNSSNTFCFTTASNNTAPTIIGEIPANTSTGISLQPTCNVTVSDADGDTVDVTFATNESGAWVNKKTVTTSSGSGLITNSAIDSWEYDAEEGDSPDMIRLGTSEYYAIVSQGDTGSENDGYIRTIHVWNNNGTIQKSLVDSFEYDIVNGVNPSICHVSGDIYAISYCNGSTVYLITIGIDDADGQIDASVTDIVQLSQSGVRSRILNMGNTVFAIVYTVPSTTVLYLETWIIDNSGNIAGSAADSVNIDSASGIYANICQVDSDTVVVVYDAGDFGQYDGYMSTWNISAAGDITNTYADFWEFDPNMGGTPTIAKVNDTTYMVAYENTAADLYVHTCTIADTGDITSSWIDSQAIDTSNGDYPTFFNVSSSNIADQWIKGITFSGSGYDGFVSTFNVTSDGTISSVIDTLEIYPDNSIYYYQPACIVYGNYFLIITEVSDDDGWAKVVEINTHSDLTWDFTDADVSNTKYYWRVYADDATVNISETYHFTTEAAAEFIWIDITNASWALGNIVMDTSIFTNETGKTFIADMDNTTVNTDLKLQITNDGADWTAATSGNGAGVDTYRLNASIDIWVADENQIITASTTTISSDITAGQNETFDLRFDAPTASTTGNEQTITTTATLVKH